MRYYSFLPLGRQAVGDVRKLGQGTNARSRKGSRIDLQLSLNSEVNWCRSLSSGISQESLDKVNCSSFAIFLFYRSNFDCFSQINSASLMMRTLNKHLTSSSSVTFPSLFANTLYHAYTTWENSTISNALKHLHTTFVPKSLLDNSAAGELFYICIGTNNHNLRDLVKGLSARLGQFRALAYHALAVLRTAETERATHYMLYVPVFVPENALTSSQTLRMPLVDAQRHHRWCSIWQVPHQSATSNRKIHFPFNEGISHF